MAHTEKKARTTTDDYELIYWPGIPGRAEPIRLVFEETGTDYRDTTKEKDGLDKVLGAIKSDYEPGEGNILPLAPPILRAGDLLLSQSPNILLYLAEKLNLIPGDVEKTKWQANQLVLTLLDLQNEIHDTHHPVAHKLYYDDQKEEAKRKAKEVKELRIPKWFDYLTRIIEQTEGPYLLSEFSYADLVAFHVIDGAKHAFPGTVEKQFKELPKVKELHETVANRARIAAYLSSERRAKYGQGIYRYYPELNEEDSEE